MKSILFVDDDKPILRAMKRSFIDTEYYIFCAESGQEALEILEKEHIDLIIADIKMPGMDGYELLKKVKILYPFIIRIILSGYIEKDMVFKIVHENIAKAFVAKPWNESDLKATIEDSFRIHDVLTNTNLLKLINSIENLPTLPNIFNKINEATQDENFSIQKVLDELEKDPVMAAKVLRMVNSAYFSIKTSSLKTAVLNLGIENIKNVILATELLWVAASNKSGELLWKHCSLTNKITSTIYKELLRSRIPECCSTAGLLHDIGYIVLLNRNKYQFLNLSDTHEKIDNCVCQNNDKKIYDLHTQVGGYLLNWWQFPNALVEVALFHHNPFMSSEENRKLVCVVHIASYYSWKLLFCSNVSELDMRAFDYIGISQKTLERLIDKISREVLKNEQN